MADGPVDFSCVGSGSSWEGNWWMDSKRKYNNWVQSNRTAPQPAAEIALNNRNETKKKTFIYQLQISWTIALSIPRYPLRQKVCRHPRISNKSYVQTWIYAWRSPRYYALDGTVTAWHTPGVQVQCTPDKRDGRGAWILSQLRGAPLYPRKRFNT